MIGNGIAGVTAADHVRRRHPSAQIDLVADEPHHLYNRMGISRLIYGRSAMQGLYLNPDAWYEERGITTWLNTQAARIDRDAREVVLGTGERLEYDRLILATGSSAFVPPIEGFGAKGTFVLRSAEDALDDPRVRPARAVPRGRSSPAAACSGSRPPTRCTSSACARRARALRPPAAPPARPARRRAPAPLHRGPRHGDRHRRRRPRGARRRPAWTWCCSRTAARCPPTCSWSCAGITPNVELAREAGLRRQARA